MLQRHAVQKLHGDDCLAALLANVMNCADVWVIQSGRCLCFTTKTLQCLAVLGHVLGHKLQSHKTVEPGIFRLVHHTHSATAEFLTDAVVRDGLTDHLSWTS